MIVFPFSQPFTLRQKERVTLKLVEGLNKYPCGSRDWCLEVHYLSISGRKISKLHEILIFTEVFVSTSHTAGFCDKDLLWLFCLIHTLSSEWRLFWWRAQETGSVCRKVSHWCPCKQIVQAPGKQPNKWYWGSCKVMQEDCSEVRGNWQHPHRQNSRTASSYLLETRGGGWWMIAAFLSATKHLWYRGTIVYFKRGKKKKNQPHHPFSIFPTSSSYFYSGKALLVPSVFSHLFPGRASLWEGILFREKDCSLLSLGLAEFVWWYPSWWYFEAPQACHFTDSLRQRMPRDLPLNMTIFVWGGEVCSAPCEEERKKNKKKNKNAAQVSFQWKPNWKRVRLRGRKWADRGCREWPEETSSEWSAVLRKEQCVKGNTSVSGVFVFMFLPE